MQPSFSLIHILGAWAESFHIHQNQCCSCSSFLVGLGGAGCQFVVGSHMIFYDGCFWTDSQFLLFTVRQSVTEQGSEAHLRHMAAPSLSLHRCLWVDAWHGSARVTPLMMKSTCIILKAIKSNFSRIFKFLTYL